MLCDKSVNPWSTSCCKQYVSNFEFLDFCSGAVEAFLILGLDILKLVDETTMLALINRHPSPSDVKPHPRRRPQCNVG
jgi:hypothetical protein